MLDDFDRLIREALKQDFSGWDFSYLHGRWREEQPPWDYRQLVVSRLDGVTSLLDMGTGGGEFLASLPNLPGHTVATENYAPNVAVAKARLNPLGIEVVSFERDDELPFADGTFDLVINRHESYSAQEVYRILQRGGRFLTQQVGADDSVELNRWLQAPLDDEGDAWALATEARALERVGFEIVAQDEAIPMTTFYDIGAVVYYLQAIPWQIPDFTVEAYRDRLLALHKYMQQAGGLAVRSPRFYLEAVKR